MIFPDISSLLQRFGKFLPLALIAVMLCSQPLNAYGQINFGSGGDLPVSVGFSSISAGDLNGDDVPDLAIIGRTNSGNKKTKVFENDDGSLTAVGANLPGFDNGSIALRDFNEDGHLDLLVTGRSSTGKKAVIYENDGSGQFPSDLGNDLTGVSQSSSAVDDLNGNGHPDLLITGDNGGGLTTSVYFNDGNGNLTAAQAGLEGVQSGYSLIRDFDSDGDADILIGGDFGTEAKTLIYENDGNGNFSKSNAGIKGVYSGTATATDFDSDGDLDILISGDKISSQFSDDPSTIVYENDGSGDIGAAFSTVDAGLVDFQSASSAAADFDEDGDVDIAISGVPSGKDSRQAIIYSNDGSGNIESAFTSVSTGITGLSGGSYLGTITTADMDADGKQDVLISGLDDNALLQSRLHFNTSNTPPNASDDEYSLQEDGQLTRSAPGVLSNDTDPDGDEITASTVSGPTNGSLNLDADGSFSYAPNADFSGTDSFTYEASDGTNDTEAKVLLTVNPDNDPPSILRNEGLSVFEGEKKTITSSELGASDPDDDASALTFSVTNGPSQGDLLVGGTASSSFTQADLKNGSVEYDHTSGTIDDDSFTFNLSDAEGEGPTGETFSISVNEANDPPSAPTGLTASGQDQQVSLTWDSNSEGDMSGGEYEVHRSTTSGFSVGSGTLVTTVSHTGGGESYIDDGSGNLSVPSNGTSYYYRVLAVDSDGSESTPSGEVAATPQSTVATDGLRAYYPFDGTAEDASGNGYDGTVNGDATAASDGQGNVEGAYALDGEDDYIDIPDEAVETTQGTVCARFQVDATSEGENDRVFSMSNIASPGGTRLYLSIAPEQTFQANFINDQLGDISIKLDRWYHTCLAWNQSDAELYVDGDVVGTAPGGTPTNGNVNVGSYGEGFKSFLDGKVDQVRIYDRPLSGDEVRTLHRRDEANTAPAAPAGLAATGGDREVELTWDSNTDNDMSTGAYEIHRSTTSGFTPGSETLVATVTHTGGGESYVDNGSGNLPAPINGTTYFYKVTAVDETGAKSEPSAEKQATPQRSPLRIASLQPENGTAGTLVRVYGSGFGSSSGDNTVTFGGVEATVENVNDRVLYVQVPSGVSGPVPVSVERASDDFKATASEQFTAVTGGAPPLWRLRLG